MALLSEQGGEMRRNLERGLVVVAALSLGITLFAYNVGWGALAADAPIWAQPKGDMLASLGGYHALLRSPWALPPTVVTQLNGLPTSIVFTDSAPWVALLFKAAPPLQQWSPLGALLLSAYLLQPLAMLALLRSLGITRFAPLLAGAVLSLLLPTWLVRQYGHMALCAHWLLLLGLALSVSCARHGLDRRRWLLFLVLVAAAAGVHPYHLPPLLLLFAAAIAAEGLQGRSRAPRLMLAGLSLLAVIGACAAFLGYGVGGGGSADPEALGHYGMNLLAPLLPVGSQLFGQAWNGAWFVKPPPDPTGGQSFEGMQYLGAGILLLLALGGLLMLRKSPARPDALHWLRRYGPLALATLALTLWAVGWRAYAGGRLVYAAPHPHGVMLELFGPFRSHGRFFWTPAYLLLGLALVAFGRLPNRVSAPLLALVVVLQFWDVGPLRQGLRDSLRAVAPAAWTSHPVLARRPWRIWPAFTCAQDPRIRQDVAALAFIAVRNGGKSNTFPTARGPVERCSDPPQPAGSTPDEILVRLEPSPAAPSDMPLADCRQLEHGVICGRGLAALAQLPPAVPASVVQPVSIFRFNRDEQRGLLIAGWHRRDPGGQGVWSQRRAAIRLPVPQTVRGRPLQIELRATGFSEPPLRPQPLEVSVANRAVGRFQVPPGDFSTLTFLVPAELTMKDELVLTLLAPEARASALDPRILGVALQSVRLGTPVGPRS